MITLERQKDHFIVNRDGKFLGKVGFRYNTFHRRNAYLDFDLCEYNCEEAAELFQKISNILRRPLQAMIVSDDRHIKAYLIAGEFVCKRRCYEMEATRQAYLGPWNNRQIQIANRGEAEYEACCKMLYEHYQRTHAAVNPLTATPEEFCGVLPDRAYYQMDEGRLKHLAFFEENEIAYVATTENDSFSAFASAVVSLILSRYPTVSFECDDCDDTAMTLRALFVSDEIRYDTYVCER